MLIRLAWRNIWRNKVRSVVLVLSVAIGLFAGMFIMAFYWGLNEQNVKDVIESQLSHVQVHHPAFQEDKMIEYRIKDGLSIQEELQKDSRVKAVCGRNISSAMISSPSFASGVMINGVKPEEEKQVTSILSDVITGSYFTTGKRSEILLGEKLAGKLGVGIKNKVVVTFQDLEGNITSGSFRITGIFKTKNSAFDERNVYTRFSDLSQLLGTGDGLHELAVLMKDNDSFETLAEEMRRQYPELKIETWKQLAPELQLMVDSFYQYMYIFIAIILLALAFGIVNTMLMAVLERQHEFGMLMAIGMGKGKVFNMILFETVMLTSIGIPLGLFLTYFTVEYFNKYGIDVSAFAKGMAKFGYTPIIYPELEPAYYLPVALMTAGSALLSAIYPAVKALRLRPTVAIRKN